MAYTQNMTEGKPFPIIFRYFVPILCSCLLQQLYSIVDTIIVGKGIDDLALAAVGATGSICFFVFGFIMGLGSGMSVLVAQAYGAGDEARVRKSIAMGIVSTGAVALVIMAAGIVWMRPLLRLMHTSDVILEDAIRYIVLILAGIPLTLLYDCFASTLNALGDSRTPLVAVLISTVVNIVLDLLLIIVCHMGVAGAAIGTLIAQGVAGGFCFLRLRRISFLRFSRSDWRIDMGLIWQEVSVGIPVAFMNSVTAIGTIVVQYFVNGLGVAYTAAYSACDRLVGLMMQPCAAAGMAMSTYAGQNFGAKKIGRIVEGLKNSFWLSVTLALLGIVFLCGFPAQLAGWMLSDPEYIALCVVFLRICGGMMWSISFLFLVRSTCQGMGFTMVPMTSGFLELAARVAATVLLTPKMGYNAIAIAEVSAWTSALLLNGGYLWWKLHRLGKGYIK